MTPFLARSLQSRLSEGETLDYLTAWGTPVAGTLTSPTLAIALSEQLVGGEATYIIVHKALIVARMKAIDLMKGEWIEHFAPSIIEQLLQTFISVPEPRHFHKDLAELDLGL